jgi:large subunit ribosomal protein L10
VAVLDNAVVDASKIEQLAKLPPRDQLLAMLAGALEAPMAALAGALEAKLQEMVGLLKALQEKRESGDA